jgi:hypothetical protein
LAFSQYCTVRQDGLAISYWQTAWIEWEQQRSEKEFVAIYVFEVFAISYW